MKKFFTIFFCLNFLEFLSNKPSSSHTFHLKRYLQDKLMHSNHSDTSEIQGNITNLGYYYVYLA